jgi:RNA polymerase sigma-70 factor (ECF subfamily)
MATDPDLWAALMALDPRSRAALILTTLDGYSQEDVGDLLGVPRGTVASWLSRARERLRPILEDRPQ